jgi:hypothetical protein
MKTTIYAPDGTKVFNDVPTFGLKDGILTFFGNDPYTKNPMEISTSLPFLLEGKAPGI